MSSKTCNKCEASKSESEFYKNGSYLRASCKTCWNSKSGEHVSNWRRRTKAKLVDRHGGKCIDCGYQGPPFMFDFDHRDPEEKSFEIGGQGITRAYDKLLEESLKCDLVCSNCHRWRTHRQRCTGCGYCSKELMS